MTTLHLNSSSKLWAIIPAAGSGQRFSSKHLKQYQEIAGQSVLQHSVARLNQLPLAGYVIACAQQDDYLQTLQFAQPTRMHRCVGGQERVQSVYNALMYLADYAADDDWVLVHDAARPCVHLDNLLELLATAQQTQHSAILATPVRDTLKKAQHQADQIEHTVSREQLWQAQTPQIAQYAVLCRALQRAMADDCLLTDEASALEYCQQPVHLVQGRADNIKITYPEDLLLAEMILIQQQSV
nr:2-C-methyl-D-erythritol 4-phosphate cytidylyltransferase [Acinetobacter larvae]